ncbi:MAG: hypothetical protein B7Z44_15420 [Caulobacter sp. 12-67-6]|nr:MAG: hypothetical protein B7Z44_15420 [Caulobacter sp. 12-67-6]OYX73021.1 MAG: hypothetical protein B7Y81_04770 [Caulobacter sp. 32-67-35]OZA74323.1 MAG: hypothetical protein B7X77_08670 [Caulobacter sp. 39-67-4]HQR88762.1 DUF1697 domain-containing protein [Caulobacter sp.]
MTTHIALLRGVSVGGQKPIAAETFVDLLTELGFANARTVGGPSNLVFDSPERTGADLQTFLETEIHTRLGLRTDIYVRTAQAWAAIIAANPYAEFAETDPGLLMTLFLKDPPDKKVIGALRTKLTEGEQLRVESRQFYVTYPNGLGASKFSNNVVEKALATRITSRSWTIVQAIGEATAETDAPALED